MATRVGSLMEYGYVPSRYGAQMSQARERLTNAMSRNVERMATGITSEVSSAVESKKKDAQLLGQANELYRISQDITNTVSQDPSKMGQRAATVQIEKPSAEWSTEKLTNYVTKTNAGLSTLVENLAGSGQLSQQTLENLQNMSVKNGWDIDFTKPMKELKAEARRGYVTEELSESAAGGLLPPMAAEEEQVSFREPAPMTEEVPAGADITAGAEAPPARYTEATITEPSSMQPAAKTEEEMYKNYLERRRRGLVPTDEPEITSTEARESLASKAFPSEAEARRLKALDIEEARVKIAQGNLSARLDTLGFQKTKEVTDILQQAYKWAIESGESQKEDLPPLHDSSGNPTINRWGDREKAIAQNLLNQYDMAIKNMKNRATVTDPRNAFFSGGVNIPTQPTPRAGARPAPAAQPAPVQPTGDKRSEAIQMLQNEGIPVTETNIQRVMSRL